ncbi:MAG: ATP-binding protein [Gemmataceae bacterium]|nr:ATP-binding protein [Gemmataceae bacterium]
METSTLTQTTKAVASNAAHFTTNIGFEQRTEVLGPERLTGGALDRLTHRCLIVESTGESDRLHDAKRRRRNEPKS